MKKLLCLLIVLVLSVMAFASCDAFVKNPDETPEASGLENAEKYVSALYKEMSVTGADYELVGQVTVDGVTYTVTWKVNVTEGVTLTKNDEKNVWNVDVYEETGAPIAYELTATITDADGNKAEKTFKLTVPKFKVNTHAEYMAAKEGDNLVIEGIITGINSKDAGSKRNHLYLVDESGVGGYYIYDMKADPVKDLNLAVGMKVRINGAAAPYGSMMEMKDGTVTAVLNKTPVTVTAYDVTAECLKDEPDLAKYVGMLVTMKGVSLGTQALEKDTDQYLYFTIGKLNSYLRTYVTDFPVGVTKADKTVIHSVCAFCKRNCCIAEFCNNCHFKVLIVFFCFKINLSCFVCYFTMIICNLRNKLSIFMIGICIILTIKKLHSRNKILVGYTYPHSGQCGKEILCRIGNTSVYCFSEHRFCKTIKQEFENAGLLKKIEKIRKNRSLCNIVNKIA